MMRLSGLCYRAGSPEPLPAGLEVPERVPLTVNFGSPIGTAALARHGNGDIHATAGLYPDSIMAEYVRRKLVPYFAVAAIEKPGEGAVICRIAVCEQNADPDLPPYEVTEDEGG